jgi:hypothetical protein
MKLEKNQRLGETKNNFVKITYFDYEVNIYLLRSTRRGCRQEDTQPSRLLSTSLFLGTPFPRST